MNPGGYVLRNGRLAGRDELVDLSLRGGHIADIQPAGADAKEQGLAELDLKGRLVIPGFVDAHMHLDKAYALDSGLEPGDSLVDAIQGFYRWRAEISPEQIYTNARRVAGQALLHGTVALRTHTTVDDGVGLTWLESLLRVKQEFAPRLRLQNAAFADTAAVVDGPGRDWLRRALAEGADLVGGAPAFCDDPERAIDLFFEVAGEAGCDLDLHVDESDDPTCNTLEILARRKLALGFKGRVNASHCCSLSAMDEATARRAIDRVAQAGISVITLPSCNLYLMGREDRGLVRRGLTRVRQLLEAGVRVSFASDNIRDSFNPFGAANMLQGALLCAHALQLGTPTELETVLKMGTLYPAQTLGLENYGLQVGNEANLVILDDAGWGSALAHLAPCRYVFSQGRLVAETLIEQKLADHLKPQ